MTLFIVLTTLLASAVCGEATASSSDAVDCESAASLVHGAKLADVLMAFGPSEGAYLAGADMERGPARGDVLVLRFVRDVVVARKHRARILAFFAPAGVSMEALRIDFESPVPEDEIILKFGKEFRRVSQRLEHDAGGMEASLSNCDSESGPYKSLLFPKSGMMATLSDEGGVTALRFAVAILDKKETYPPCSGG